MQTPSLSTLGTAGLWVTALASPCCFPLLAVGASALGLGSFELFGGWTMYVFQALVLLSVAGTAASVRQHGHWGPLAGAAGGAALIMSAYYLDFSLPRVYAGMVGLLGAAAWTHRLTKSTMNQPLVLQSRLTCPACGHQQTETMATDACQYFYECPACRTVLKPKPGDCCVFCSYGTVACPPIQQGQACC